MKEKWNNQFIYLL